MAKAKKPTDDDTKKPAPDTKATPRKAAPKKAVSSASAKPATTKKTAGAVLHAGTPMVDTGLAAQAVATMFANRAAMRQAGATGAIDAPASDEPKKESSTFKQLKDSLNKPTLGNAAGLLGNVGGQKKSNLPFAGDKQVGRNQTFGADVNRTGVPRRTGGG
ncbi:MAG: hypothetical protein ACREIT_06440 [Tepidisphaeraceae bacterium]